MESRQPEKRELSPPPKNSHNKRHQGDFSSDPNRWSSDGGKTTASSQYNTETSSNPSDQTTQSSELIITQKIDNAVEKEIKGIELTKDDKKYLLWHKKNKGGKLSSNEKRSLALFKKKNEADLSDGEEKFVNQTNNHNSKYNEKRNKEVSLALAIESNIKGEKPLTPNQQELLNQIPEKNRKNLTDRQKSLIERYNNNSKKQRERLTDNGSLGEDHSLLDINPDVESLSDDHPSLSHYLNDFISQFGTSDSFTAYFDAIYNDTSTSNADWLYQD